MSVFRVFRTTIHESFLGLRKLSSFLLVLLLLLLLFLLLFLVLLLASNRKSEIENRKSPAVLFLQ